MLLTQDLVVGHHGRPVAAIADFEAGSGEAVLLLGPSGSGKSTALFTLGGLLPVISGAITLDKAPFSALSAGRRDRLRGSRIGMIFQDVHLLPGLSVLDNVLLGPFAAGARQDREAALARIEELGLADARHRKAETLSRGEAQRIAIARAMLMNPSLILADEPTASLDDANAGLVADLLIRAASETGAALVIATHDHRLKTRFTRRIDVAALATRQETLA
ncbi:Lipoprotein-releasing system ATP-binding protein LolD [Brevundimonas sp. NIBR10]|uniref:ABC transporter ATP-binding protein n=1 Tax=Brevundimonas sp. NIBR10 TaxID=3015997 RepID=UPI0022F1A241|nr:ATP-binding cassette domain-containing protein [Brevundimonas sp. NIBR10]WGM45887.1 Lipoprotein-releasing system ATP-binding protein LolD [Brevundimonas sp. NIBR10]